MTAEQFLEVLLLEQPNYYGMKERERERKISTYWERRRKAINMFAKAYAKTPLEKSNYLKSIMEMVENVHGVIPHKLKDTPEILDLMFNM